MNVKPSYPSPISFRPRDRALHCRIERLANLERRPVSQLVRIMVEDAVDAMEASKGLPPLDSSGHASTNGGANESTSSSTESGTERNANNSGNGKASLQAGLQAYRP